MLSVQLPRARDCAGMARRFVQGALRDVASGSTLEHAMLVASELVTNAYRHGSGNIELRMRLGPRRVVVEVVDEGKGAALEVRQHDPHRDGGWGLQIVEQVALRWGAFEGTTHVWAELPLD